MTWLWRPFLTALIVVFSLVGNLLLAQPTVPSLACDGVDCQLTIPGAAAAFLVDVEDNLQDSAERDTADRDGADRDGEQDPDAEIFSPLHEPLRAQRRQLNLCELMLNPRGLSADRGTCVLIFRPPQV